MTSAFALLAAECRHAEPLALPHRVHQLVALVEPDQWLHQARCLAKYQVLHRLAAVPWADADAAVFAAAADLVDRMVLCSLALPPRSQHEFRLKVAPLLAPELDELLGTWADQAAGLLPGHRLRLVHACEGACLLARAFPGITGDHSAAALLAIQVWKADGPALDTRERLTHVLLRTEWHLLGLFLPTVRALAQAMDPQWMPLVVTLAQANPAALEAICQLLHGVLDTLVNHTAVAVLARAARALVVAAAPFHHPLPAASLVATVYRHPSVLDAFTTAMVYGDDQCAVDTLVLVVAVVDAANPVVWDMFTSPTTSPRLSDALFAFRTMEVCTAMAVPPSRVASALVFATSKVLCLDTQAPVPRALNYTAPYTAAVWCLLLGWFASPPAINAVVVDLLTSLASLHRSAIVDLTAGLFGSSLEWLRQECMRQPEEDPRELPSPPSSLAHLFTDVCRTLPCRWAQQKSFLWAVPLPDSLLLSPGLATSNHWDDNAHLFVLLHIQLYAVAVVVAIRDEP